MNVDPCCSFTVKMPFSSNKTSTAAASRPISLAAATVALPTCSFGSSSVVFKGSFQQSLAAFVTTKGTLKWLLSAKTENTLDWSSARWICKISDLKSQ